MQGKSINGFELKKLLGTGGMAEVWYAENEIGMKAAVKILSEELSHNAQMKERFLNEAKVMVQLDHPNIRKVHGYGNINGRPAIIMEYLDGSDLKARMKRGQHFTDEELRKWWNQIVDALNYTHALHIVHRDIKPSNIFIDQKGDAKLLDFGIAKVADTTSGTLTGSTLGTRIYMSPEQVKDPKRVGTASDVYSLAVSFVHLLTGKAPYDSTTSSDYDIQVSIVTKPVDMSKVPEEWRGFLTPYLNKEADKRPALRHFELVNPEEKAAKHTDDDTTLAEDEKQLEVKPVPMPKPRQNLVNSQQSKSKNKSKCKRDFKRDLWIGIGVTVAVVTVLLLCRDPYKKIDQWLAESEQFYGACRIDSLKEDYTSAVDSLNLGYASCVKALQALKELRNPDPQAFIQRKQRCDSLDSLYVSSVAAIIEQELIRSSVADDTLAACARLRQLEELCCYKRDSTGCTLKETIERDIDILYNKVLLRVRRNGKYGWVDTTGEMVIKPQFDYCTGILDDQKRTKRFYEYEGWCFDDKIAAVKVNSNWGCINKLGIMIVKPQFDDLCFFSDGLVLVKTNGKYGLIDKLGNMITKPQFDEMWSFSEGIAKVKANEKLGFIDKSGNFVVEPQFDGASSFSEGLAWVKTNGKYGFIDKSGNMVIKPQFDAAFSFSEGLAGVKTKGKYGFIDTLGNIVAKPQFDGANPFSEGLALVKINGKYGFIDKSGNMVIKPQFDYAGSFSDGLARVKTKGKYGFIDTLGNIIAKPQYDDMGWSFQEGLIRVETKGKYGFVDKSGNLVVIPTFDYIMNFSEGLARVNTNGKYGFIDKSGNMVIKPQYDGAGSFSDGLAIVCVNGKAGYIDTSENMVIEAKYDIDFHFPNANSFRRGVAQVSLDGVGYYIDKLGKRIFKIEE